MPNVSLSDDVYVQVRTLARFAGCSDNEVIRRLLERLEPKDAAPAPRSYPSPASTDDGARYLPGRAPRERGATVRLGGELLRVDSVPDLFEHVLRHIVKHGKRNEVTRMLPYKTSAQRYLIAEKPVHPSGKDFYVPVKHGGLYMEAHKSYRTAIKDLAEFLRALGVPFEYVTG